MLRTSQFQVFLSNKVNLILLRLLSLPVYSAGHESNCVYCPAEGSISLFFVFYGCLVDWIWQFGFNWEHEIRLTWLADYICFNLLLLQMICTVFWCRSTHSQLPWYRSWNHRNKATRCHVKYTIKTKIQLKPNQAFISLNMNHFSLQIHWHCEQILNPN